MSTPAHRPGAYLQPVTSIPRDPRLDLRVGDAEREACTARLGAAFAAGQLDADEYAERMTIATGAVHARDLVVLTADLPAAASPAPTPGARPRPNGAWVAFDVVVAVLALVAFLCLVFWQMAVFSLPHGYGFVAVVNAIGAGTVVGCLVHLAHRYLGRRQ